MRPIQFKRLEKRRVGGTRDHMELAYPAPRSPSGKVYQLSPNPDALPRLFLLGDAPAARTIAEDNLHRIRRRPGKGQTVCPYSGFIADDDEFVHFDDVAAVKKQLEWEVLADVEDQLAEMAKAFNRRLPKNGLISLQMDVTRRHRPRPLVIREDLLRNLECNVCARAYAVYAIGLFCPDCGAPNVAQHFRREEELVRKQVELADAQTGTGESEIGYRLMGNAHEDVLTAFEATTKAIYRHLVRERLPERARDLASYEKIGTGFQRIDGARKLFGALAIDPFDSLDSAELDTLECNIQKRHVIGHNLSLADERFTERTAEGEVGRTIQIIGEDIVVFAQICQKVIGGLGERLSPGGNAV